MIKPNGLNPFKRFCITIGELPTSYMESMTYYEMLEWFCKYLEKTVIPAVNNNAEALEELQNLFVELKSYVDNYFANLDVQEEINNKLDEMAESGELADIINVEMIGSLQDLNTTDKSNLVSAINEVLGIASEITKFNLTQFNTTEYTDLVKVNTSNGNLSVSVATNSDGSIAKIYGQGYINIDTVASEVVMSLNSSLRPTSDITINASVVALGDANGGQGGYLVIRTTGVIEVHIYASAENQNYNVIISPCLYFIKDFGDVQQ